jgi:hypothetical protein
MAYIFLRVPPARETKPVYLDAQLTVSKTFCPLCCLALDPLAVDAMPPMLTVAIFIAEKMFPFLSSFPAKTPFYVCQSRSRYQKLSWTIWFAHFRPHFKSLPRL